MEYDIITIGEILVEVLTEEVGQRFDTTGKLSGPYPSGAPAIAIDQVGKMGASAAIVARVGADDFGKINLDRLQASGVDTSHVVVSPTNTTGVAFVTYFPDGNRQFIFHFSHAACGELNTGDVPEDVVASTKYLHIMGCSITASPSLAAAVMEGVRLAVKHGVKVSFDPNVRPELLKGEIMDNYREILSACHVLLTGKSELELLYPNGQDGIATLLAEKDRIVVVKDGSRGTEVHTRDGGFRVDTYPATEVDPTGAGDCFDGTFLSMLCQGASLQEAANMANAAGAHAVGKKGPMGGNIAKADLLQYLATTPPATITQL